MPFTAVVQYREPSRCPDVLWTMPFLRDGAGRMHYLAAGPAGKPFGAHLVARVDFVGLPADVNVEAVMVTNSAGTLVYGVPDHTVN